MSRDYAERKIRESLSTSGGNETRARQKIIAWAMEDARLLQELVAPHLTGIVAHAINRTLAMKDKPARALPPAPPIPKKGEASAKGDPFGMEILKAIALGNPAQFGLEGGAAPVKKHAASQRHIDAIKQMVSKGESSKGESSKGKTSK